MILGIMGGAILEKNSEAVMGKEVFIFPGNFTTYFEPREDCITKL